MRQKLLLLGIVCFALGGGALALGWREDPRRASYSYLFAYASVLSVVLGTVFLVMIGHAANARWFVVVRRQAEHVIAVLPLLAVLLLPILFEMRRLYPWTRPLELTADAQALLAKKASWLNPRSFTARSAAYCVVFVTIGELLRSWSLRQDQRAVDGAPLRRRMVALSAGALFGLALALTFASFDWLMSLEPTWYSNLYGVYVFAGGFLSALGLLGVCFVAARVRGLLPAAAATEHYHAIGRLELAMVIFWAYIAWAQLVLYWIADMPLEVTWYISRWTHGWQWVGLSLLVFHWLIPFFALLSRSLKRRPETFFAISLWLVLVHTIDVYYLVLPALGPLRFRTTDVAAPLAIAGAAIAFGAWRAGAISPYPLNDPLLADSLKYEVV